MKVNSTPNEQLFPKQVVIQLPLLKTEQQSFFTNFLFQITKQNKTGSIMAMLFNEKTFNIFFTYLAPPRPTHASLPEKYNLKHEKCSKCS